MAAGTLAIALSRFSDYVVFFTSAHFKTPFSSIGGIEGRIGWCDVENPAVVLPWLMNLLAQNMGQWVEWRIAGANLSTGPRACTSPVTWGNLQADEIWA